VREAFRKRGHDAHSCDLLDTEIPGPHYIGDALENPIGCISTAIRPYDQVIQPYQFGADASKKTCLWLKNLPLLKPVMRVPGRRVMHNGKWVERWANQTDSGQKTG